jgi:hypothetical protein
MVMDGQTNIEKSGRGTGVVLVLSAIASVALLASHPEGSAHDFAGMLRGEAASRLADAIVHGGFIAVLAIQLVCYAALSVQLGATRVAVMAGFILFAIGTAALMGSLLIDGLIIPDLAARNVGLAVEKQNLVRGAFAFAGAAIKVLMPMGLLLQGSGIAAWGVSLAKPASATAIAGFVLGAAIVAAPVVSIATANPMILMLAIPGTALWAAIAGLWLMRRA